MFAGKSSRSGSARLAILLVVLVACTAPPVETNPAPVMPSSNLTPGTAFAPTDTPTEVPTSTPFPILILTPQPEWVTTFAQPILDAIANRPPDFQDDFHDKSGGWHSENMCADWKIEYVDGELLPTAGCRVSRYDIDYTNFVAEVDGRFLPGSAKRSDWRIYFRFFAPCGYYISIDLYGSVHLFNQDFDFAGLPDDQTNHLMVIAKGSRFAFYVNDQPLYYADLAGSTYCQSGNISLTATNRESELGFPGETFVAFDNFKIWNLANLP